LDAVLANKFTDDVALFASTLHRKLTASVARFQELRTTYEELSGLLTSQNTKTFDFRLKGTPPSPITTICTNHYLQ
jgi:hypothetical protein